uniref:Uncharacterized protein n=1 Tax=Anguilla anguilla TaxID=7936 RepID=A0A0E9VFI5_ANGAN
MFSPQPFTGIEFSPSGKKTASFSCK